MITKARLFPETGMAGLPIGKLRRDSPPLQSSRLRGSKLNTCSKKSGKCVDFGVPIRYNRGNEERLGIYAPGGRLSPHARPAAG